MDEENLSEKHTESRRRGKILEDAILEAAWDELRELGYNRMTMEGVAARAKTNKAVVYRRWESKSTLVVAALQIYMLPMLPKEVPDTGNIRDDIYQMLQGLAEPLRFIGTETIRGLMGDALGKAIKAAAQKEHKDDGEKMLTEGVTKILLNAEKRGELIAAKVPIRVARLPLDLFRLELFTHREPISDEILSEIVDDIFMPLVLGYMKIDT